MKNVHVPTGFGGRQAELVRPAIAVECAQVRGECRAPAPARSAAAAFI